MFFKEIIIRDLLVLFSTNGLEYILLLFVF